MEKKLMDELKSYLLAMYDQPGIEIDNTGRPLQVEAMHMEEARVRNFGQSFLDGMAKGSRFLSKWKQKPVGRTKGPKPQGNVDIIELKKILDWGNKEALSSYGEEGMEEDHPMRDFYLVDMHQPESQVGIFAGKHRTNSLYAYDIAEKPEYLGVDMNGYLKLLFLSRGYFYWYRALLDLQRHKEDPAHQDSTETINFKKHMPELFPDFKWEEFEALYWSLYIDEPRVSFEGYE